MHLFRPWALLAALTGPLFSAGQTTVRGRVVDDATLEPLAFVHVLAEGVRDGTTTDIDGRFSLTVPSLPARLRFSYVGHQTVEADITGDAPVLVRMKRGTMQLPSVEVLPGENPAHRIIQRVHANRRANDGLRNRAHRYTSYSKTVFTAALDSAVLNDPARLAALDSNDRRAMDWLEKQHLFLIESATKRSFVPPASEKEEVIAMRVSGLKDPSMMALAASTKTFSVYEPRIEVGSRTYLGPIGPNSTERYLFILEDTLFQGRDTVYIISYQPRSGRKFDALKGVLHVNSNGYALQNAIAEPAERTGNYSVKLQQRFERVKGGAWFPVQLNTFLYIGFVQVNTWKVVGIGRTYLKDIEVDAAIPKREVRGPEFVMDRLAVRRDSAFWSTLRTDTLSGKELRTYHAVDSLSKAENIEQKVRWYGRLATGRLRAGPIDLELDKLLRYNGYEGLRLGLGASTHRGFSRYMWLGGHVAYGFADEAWKYGGEVGVRPWPGRGPSLRTWYANDVDESGGVSFQSLPRSLFSTENYRWFFVDRMDRIERFGAEVAFRVGGPLRMWVGTERAERVNMIGYQYASPVSEGVTLLSDRFLTGAVTVGFRFAFRERLARLPESQFGLGTKWPVLHANVTRMVDGLWGGGWSLWRANAMLEKTFRMPMLGELSIRAMGGMADRSAPYPFLFNPRGTFSRDLPLATRNTFETMRPNEFLADRYAAVHLGHSFGNLLFKGGKKFKPVPVVVLNAGWGALARPEHHRGYTFAAFTDGYYEGGLRIDNLLRLGFTSIGAGAFLRMGPHSLPDATDNLAVKLVMGLGR